MSDVTVIIVSIVAALATYYISINLGKGAVFASALVTLAAGIVFPHFLPDGGARLAIMATTASYAAMVAPAKFPKIWEMGIVGLIAGLIFIATSSAYVGVGGKLGTIAAISCLTWLGVKKVHSLATKPKAEEEPNVKPVN